jgi:hypothetical protein
MLTDSEDRTWIKPSELMQMRESFPEIIADALSVAARDVATLEDSTDRPTPQAVNDARNVLQLLLD